MSANNRPRIDAEVDAFSEGGLRAPPEYGPLRKAWWWFDFIILVKLARLRFIAVLVVIGLIIVKWDTLMAYYERWTRPADAQAPAHGDVEFFCPMHPTVIRDNNKEKCPICFMPLSKRKKGSGTPEALPAGVVNRVQLSPYRAALAGVRTWKVDYVPLSKDIVTVGSVEFSERGLKQVAARVKGRIDRLLVDQTGVMVHTGDELAALYSPDLNVTVQNLLDAKRANDAGMLRVARERLELWGIDRPQIDKIIQTGEGNSHLRIRSPMNGHVIKKYVREGQYVDEGTPLYDLADVSTVWVQAQVYEDDMVFLPPTSRFHTGEPKPEDRLPVNATTPAFPGEKFGGFLSFIQPHVDPNTRTVTVRFEIANPEHRLRPGTTATVALKAPLAAIKGLQLRDGAVLAVPESAVIDTGSQKIVYREATPNVFEGVLVETGPRMQGPDDATYYPLLKGLGSGDRIVLTGAFLVDAETRLNPAAGSIYFGGSGGGKAGATTQTRPSMPNDEEEEVAAALGKLSDADRKLALEQGFCPVLENSRLGGMGTPIKLMLDGQPLFVCCKGCVEEAKAKPKEMLDRVQKRKGMKPKGK